MAESYRIRRPVHEYILRSRYLGLPALQLEQRRLHRFTILTLFILEKRKPLRERNFHHVRTEIARYLLMWQQARLPERLPNPSPFLLVNVPETEARNLFRFCKPDLIRLFSLLEFSTSISLPSRHLFYSEEIFLFSLRRLAFPCRIDDLLTERGGYFGRDSTSWSRAFTWFLQTLTEKYFPLLTNSISWWFHRFDNYVGAINRKVDNRAHRVVGFIDDNIKRSCRPSSGPGINRVNGVHQAEQREVYSGYKKLHGLKWQTIDFPDGMIGEIYGPISARRNDCFVLNESRLNERMAQLLMHLEPEESYCIFGDSIFPILGYIRHFSGTQEWASVRISIEWGYGKIAGLWSFLDYKQNLQLKQFKVPLIYFVATLLTNFHTCFYGCETSTYFGVQPPTIEEYISALEEINS